MSVTETIKRVLKDYHERISTLEDEKFDLEYAVKKKDFEVECGFTASRSSSSDTLCRCRTVSLPRYIRGLRFQVHVPVVASYMSHRTGLLELVV